MAKNPVHPLTILYIFMVKQHSIQRLNLVCVSEAAQQIVLQLKECEIPTRQENEQLLSVFS